MDRQHERLLSVLNRFVGTPVLVVGDLILDEFIWGRVDRISPEAPVPVVEVLRETVHLGGAANVADNLAVLGAEPRLIGVIGDDEAGRRLEAELRRRGIGTHGLVRDPERPTSVKTRIIAHHQQVCRTDRESRKKVEPGIAGQLRNCFEKELRDGISVVLSDYAKGVLSDELISHLIASARARSAFVTVDPKSASFRKYMGASILTPNRKEAETASGTEISDEQSAMEACRRLSLETGAGAILVTRGEEGMTLYEDGSLFQVPAAAREVFDVTGAGDTVAAVLALAVACGASLRESCVLANCAAGVVVGKLGTAAATQTEIREALLQGSNEFV